jgi:pheromone shutdown protein TraB
MEPHGIMISISDSFLSNALGLASMDMLFAGTFSPLSQLGMLAAGIAPLVIQDFLGKELYNSSKFSDQALVLAGSALATAATTAALAYFEEVKPLVTIGASVAMLGLSYTKEEHSRG